MQTPSHLLMTAFAGHQLKPKLQIPLITSMLLLGSVLPDLPFTLLTLLGEIWFLWFQPLPEVGHNATSLQVMEYLHFDRFFHDPLWIVSHNFFHSLIINTVLIGVGWWGFRRDQGWGLPLFWLTVSTQVHTVIDIFTHSSDGPLIFFPFNWAYRFHSPVSYWESANYGWAFMLFEYTLDAFFLGYFGWLWWKRHKAARISSI